MKTLENLSITVKYKVGYGGVTVTEKILKQLSKAHESGDEITSHNYPDLFEWIIANVKERDCFDYIANIDDMNILKGK